jgi:hypothetical protein
MHSGGVYGDLEQLDGKGARMITVDVYVPSVDETFDMQLDENVEIKRIIGEIVELVAGKTKSDQVPDPEQFSLYVAEHQIELYREATLSGSGIRDGNQLLLV